MIPENLIIDNYDVKTPNEVRDNSFQKFCEDMDINEEIVSEDKTVENGETIITITRRKFFNVTVKRTSSGEISHWQTAFKVVE